MAGKHVSHSDESQLRTHKDLARENEMLRQQAAMLKTRLDDSENAEKALRESEKRLRLSLDATQDGVWDWDIASDSGSFTSHCYSMLGYMPGEISPAFESWANIAHPDDTRMLWLSFHRHLETGEHFTREVRMRHKSGEWHWILTRGKVVERDGKGNPLRMIGTFTDIHPRKLAEEELQAYRGCLEDQVAQRTEELERANRELQQAELRYRTVADFTYDWESWESRDGSFIYVSPSCRRITGYDAEHFLKNPGFMKEIIHPGDRQIWARHTKTAHRNRETQEVQFRITRQDGEVCWVEHVCRPVLDNHGNFLGVRASNRDVTGRKQVEEQLQASLQEKEILLMEIHHRVKNSLSMVASLLALQAGKFREPLLKEALKESQNRLRSIALIHEKLYQAGNLAKLDFMLYIRSILAILFTTYPREGVTFTVSPGPVHLPPNIAIPLALITNELATNALKYAFPGGREGVIHVDMATSGKGLVVMTVGDNGTGFPAEIDFRKTSSLGLEVVNMLVKQIGGTIEMSREKGTTFTIMFRTTR